MEVIPASGSSRCQNNFAVCFTNDDNINLALKYYAIFLCNKKDYLFFFFFNSLFIHVFMLTDFHFESSFGA